MSCQSYTGVAFKISSLVAIVVLLVSFFHCNINSVCMAYSALDEGVELASAQGIGGGGGASSSNKYNKNCFFSKFLAKRYPFSRGVAFCFMRYFIYSSSKGGMQS